ncbi:MAG TPA: ABC transporter ATP-binding protein [Methanocorpusculum sp.]|nr:ABC transporter ATP-binding protein [Methanocorpusculum sp.]
MTNNILDVCNLNIEFPTRYRTIQPTQDVSFSIKENVIYVLIGESGSGKSVIGQAILHILPKTANVSGNVYYKGQEILNISDQAYSKFRGNQIALIPQISTESLNPTMKCYNQISEVLDIRNIPKEDQKPIIFDILKSYYFKDPELVSNSYPYQLSGGMQQRITTSAAISTEPQLLIADEPTKGLDYVSRQHVIDIFKNIKSNGGMSILMITHDIELAEGIGDTVGVLYSGELVEQGSASDVFNDPLHPYTKGLISALPKNGMIPIPGNPPDLLDLWKNGCYFYDRCPHKCEITCHPSLQSVNNTNRSVRCSRY